MKIRLQKSQRRTTILYKKKWSEVYTFVHFSDPWSAWCSSSPGTYCVLPTHCSYSLFVTTKFGDSKTKVTYRIGEVLPVRLEGFVWTTAQSPTLVGSFDRGSLTCYFESLLIWLSCTFLTFLSFSSLVIVEDWRRSVGRWIDSFKLRCFCYIRSDVVL